MQHSFTRRLAPAVPNQPRLLAAVPRHEESQEPDHDNIFGQSSRNDARLPPYRYHYYAGDDDAACEFRIGPMLYDRNITDAFDYYHEGAKYAALTCSYPPYTTLHSQPLEVVYYAAAVASMGQNGDAGAAGGDIYNLMLGNGFAIGLPDECHLPQADANTFVLQGFRNLVRDADQGLRDAINLRLNNPEWNTNATAQNAPHEAILPVLECAAAGTTQQARQTMMNLYVGIFLAYTQQGNITQTKLTKIITELAGMGMTLTLTRDQIRSAWDRFGPYFDASCAAVFFPRWRTMMRGRNLRMELIFQQTANAGLTGMTLVRDAIAAYPDFYWGKLAHIAAEDWNRFVQAHRLVGDNIYYGFKKELGIVGVKNYKSIVYCAKQLNIRVGGDQNMNNLQTISNFVIPSAPAIDRLIQDYITAKGHQAGEGNRAAALAYFDNDDIIPPNFDQPPAAPEQPPDQMGLINAMIAQLALGQRGAGNAPPAGDAPAANPPNPANLR